MKVFRTFALALAALGICLAINEVPYAHDGAWWAGVASAQDELGGADSPAEPSPSSPGLDEGDITSSASPAAPGESQAEEDLGKVYNRNLHSIEEEVNGLKEKVFRSKARLLLLRETVLHGVVSGAKAILYHINELGDPYAIEAVTYFLDGTKIFSRSDTSGELARKKELKIFEGSLPPGNHQVAANVVIRGSGGIFSYLSQYTLKVQGSYSFIAQEGKVSRVKIIVYERGGFTQDFTERPYFRWEVQTDRNLPSSEDSP